MLFVSVCIVGFSLAIGLWMGKSYTARDWEVFIVALVFFLFGGMFIFPYSKDTSNALLYLSFVNQISCVFFLIGWGIQKNFRDDIRTEVLIDANRLSAVSKGQDIEWGTGVFVSIVTGCIAVCCSALWIATLSEVGIVHDEQQLVSILVEGSPSIKVLSFFFIVILAPICEELVFRKLLLSLLLEKMDTSFAIITSGLLFGVMHLESITSVPPLIIFGILLGWLKIKYNSLFFPIFAHITNNSIVILILM
jgi:membrane protease YdiL (CAAX protease family)